MLTLSNISSEAIGHVNFQCWGVLLIWIIVGQGPTALSISAGGACLDIFSLVYLFSFSLSGRRPDID